MTATIQPAGIAGWRIFVIGAVALLATGIGVAAGSALLTRGTAGAIGPGAAYVPASAPFYLEWRLDPSTEQDAAVRELLGRFPAIEGLDHERPLYDQFGELADEGFGAQTEVELSWEQDVASWFDGSVAVAITEVDWASLAEPVDPMLEPPVPGMVVVAGVTDVEAAEAAVDKVRQAAEDDGASFTETEHRGLTITSTGEGQEGAWVVTEDAFLAAPSVDDVIAALDAKASGSGGTTLAGSEEMRELVSRLPADWIGFAAFDFTELMAASMDQAAGTDPAAAEAMRAILEHQPMRGAMAITAGGDRVAIDGVGPPPTGPYAPVNADRGLAAEVPADALYFADGGNLGEALAAMIASVKQAARSDPMAAEQVDTAEAALGADLEELVSWVESGALVAGWDGSEPYAGLVLVPNDMEAAERRLDQLMTFVELAASDPASGVTIAEREVAGSTVTTITWNDPNAVPGGMPGISAPTGVAVELAVSEDRAIIGVGERFVGRVLELDPADGLASVPGYADAVAELGGAENTGVVYMDLGGTREAIETALAEMMGVMDPDGVYETQVRPWLQPLDRVVTVSRLEGDFLVSRTVLYLE